MPGPLPLLLLLGCRPEVGSPGAYTDADELRTIDGPTGRARVHYSDRGPNAVDHTDRDLDGIPDRAASTVTLAEDTLARFAALGFAAPLAEAEVGLDGLGGSSALDLYLVDLRDTRYGGWAAPDACAGARCVVHLVAPSDEEGTDYVFDEVLVHELFHAVQAAYDYTEPGWLLEGPAAHIEELAGSRLTSWWDDYLSRTDCGLADINGLHPCEAAAYGSAILWAYLEARVDEDVLLHTIEATVAHDGVAALEAGLAESGADLAEEWPGFVAWNLATGPRAGGEDDGYEFADDVAGVTADAEGPSLAVPARLAPLSARYYRVDHGGGPLWIGVDGDPGPLRVTVHPVRDGAADGPLAATRGPYGLPADAALDLGEIDAGGVWIAVSNPDAHAGSVEIGLCIGAEADARDCRPGVQGCATAGGPPWLAVVGLLAIRRARS